MNMKVLFRVDADAKIGIGHLWRCLALAEELRRKGTDVFFLTRRMLGKKLLRKSGFKTVFVAGRRISPAYVKAIEKISADVVVIDLRYSASYQTEVDFLFENSVFLVHIDDYAPKKAFFCGDVIVNGQSFAKDLTYNIGKNTKLLLGPKYMLLRPCFQKKKDEVSNCVEKVLIMMGGADVQNLTPFVVRTVAPLFKSKEVTIVVGDPSKKEKIKKTVTACSMEARMVLNPSNIQEIMKWADLAISSGGMTANELSALGVPTVVVSQNSDEDANSRKLAERGAVLRAGVGRSGVHALRKTLTRLMRNYALRKKISDKGKQLFDGKGCQRVAGIILSRPIRVKIRRAKHADSEMLRKWRNEESTRKWSFTQRKIKKKEHAAWFRRILSDPRHVQYIIMANGRQCGQIRLDFTKGRKAEIDISIRNVFRGKGLAKKALELVEHVWRGRGITLEARVKKLNFSSRRLFEACRFQQRKERYKNWDIIYFWKGI